VSSISAVLGVVVGIAFLFLLLSLVASAAGEVISTVFRLRASMLDRTVRALLTGVWAKKATTGHPHAEKATALLEDPRCRTGYPGMQGKRPHPTYLATPTFVDLIFKHFIEPGSPDPVATQSALDRLPVDGAGDMLRGLWADANHDVDAFRDHVGRWYDDAMDRLSGWYKRRLRLILFALGGLLAVGLNVSLLNVGKTLWADPIARESFIAQAKSTAAPVSPWTTVSADAAKSTDAGKPVADVLTNYRSLTGQGLPLGWRSGASPKHPLGWVAAIIGWLIVALGVSMGAPFWFDVLSKFANLRLSGGPGSPPTRPQRRGGPRPWPGPGGYPGTASGGPGGGRGAGMGPTSDPRGGPGGPTGLGRGAQHQAGGTGRSTTSPGLPTGALLPLGEAKAVRTGFDPRRHGFHFDNHFENKYELPFVVGKTITTYGRCGGMAYAALDFYLANEPMPPDVEAPADDTPLARYILRRLVDSWVNPSATRFVTWSTKNDETLHALTGHEIDVITASIDGGQPVPLGLIAAASISGISHNHQVLAFGYQRRTNGDIEIAVYDNNSHDETVTFTWSPDRVGVAASNMDRPWRGCFVHSYSRQEPPPDLV
jgi:hypothetical protein